MTLCARVHKLRWQRAERGAYLGQYDKNITDGGTSEEARVPKGRFAGVWIVRCVVCKMKSWLNRWPGCGEVFLATVGLMLERRIEAIFLFDFGFDVSGGVWKACCCCSVIESVRSLYGHA